MKILSNDYRSNLPGEADIAHGGPANFTRAFSSYAAKHGHAWVGVVCRFGTGKRPRIARVPFAGRKMYYDFFLPEERYHSFLKLAKKQDPKTWFAGEIASARRLMRRIGPDILFLNGFSVYAWILLEAAAQEALPVVIQHAGIARIEFDQYKHLYTWAGRQMMRAMERDIVTVARTQVFLNTSSKDMFSAVVAPVPAAQALIIPLPYSERFARAATRAQKKEDAARQGIAIGCVARWDRIKNHRALLRIAQEAKRRGLPWTFKSVTLLPDSKRDIRFKNAYRRALEVIPPMNQEALLSFYRSVDLLILPSHFDVSPTVVMEAALLGKRTLIAPGVGWNAEYRANGLGDWITEMTDPARVVRKVSKLLHAPASERFQHMIRTDHAPNKVFAAYLRAFTNASNVCA